MSSNNSPPKNPQPQRRESSAPPDSVTPGSDSLPSDLRRTDQSAVPPDSLPELDQEAPADDDIPLAAQRPSEDGGIAQHPIHDDDPSEDFTPGDYEEQIEEIADVRGPRNAGSGTS